MKELRVGVLGAAGQRGKYLAELFAQVSGVSVTQLADTEGEAQAVFTSPHVEVVVVATPDWLHEEHAIAALHAGKDVYLEKPMAITPEGCDCIIRAARESGRVLYVGHNLRHFTVIKKLKELVDSGVVGEVKAVWCRHPVGYGRWAYFQEGRWHKKRKNIGGLLVHKGSHDLDIIHWLGGGRSVRVVAMGTLAVWHDQPGEPDVEDVSSVLMQLDNGVQATYEQCHFAFRSAREYTILGTRGTLQNVGDNPADAVVQLFTKRGKEFSGAPPQEWRFEKEQGFHGSADKSIVEEFVGTLRGERKPSISIEDASWAVKTGWAATQSLRSGSIPIPII